MCWRNLQAQISRAHTCVDCTAIRKVCIDWSEIGFNSDLRGADVGGHVDEADVLDDPIDAVDNRIDPTAGNINDDVGIARFLGEHQTFVDRVR